MANERFVIPADAHWNDVRETPKDVGQAIQNALRAIEAANPDRLDGIFGDAPWTNKERLPDRTLKNLLEHFSQYTLSIANVPEDELGNAYEYLIKQFADDSGHTAQEFYTNRTVVHLMVQMLDPQPGERIYDPTCGTGGMLISALDQVKRSGGEYRTLKLYGQERNHMTASIARMNLALHGVDDFAIARGDTLERPAFIERDRLATFDVVLANPPYSIKQWNREAWSKRPVGTQLPGHAAAGTRRLCLLPAHSQEPGPENRTLCHPLPAWGLVPQGRSGHAPEIGGGRPGGVRAGAGTQPVLQLADGSLHRDLPYNPSRRNDAERCCSSTR